MILEEISILDFKNIEECHLHFSPKINCFTGNNGMGKTSLLDAIYYLSFTKSFLQATDTHSIREGKECFFLQGIYSYDEQKHEFSCGLRREGKKQFRKNKKEYERLSDHIGEIPLVLSSPSDLSLVLGGSEERRKFVDMVISQYDRNYLYAVIKYLKNLKERNYLLRTYGKNVDKSLLTIYEEQMKTFGETIFEGRRTFAERFSFVFQEFYNRIASKKERVSISYHSDIYSHSFEELFSLSLERDFLLGYTTKGVHKDDFDFFIDGRKIKEGSQGQIKTFLVSLRFAQFNFLKSICQRKPILLLDDLFDKLDLERVEEIISIVSEDDFGQIFLTDTNRNHLQEIVRKQPTDYNLFDVNKGNIQRV